MLIINQGREVRTAAEFTITNLRAIVIIPTLKDSHQRQQSYEGNQKREETNEFSNLFQQACKNFT